MNQKQFGIIEVVAKLPERELLEPPDDIVFDFPAPPSINRNAAEARLGNSCSRVVRWRRAADAHLIYTRQNHKLGNPIIGWFCIDIIWDRNLRSGKPGDIDNRIKYLLDYLQALRIIENDGDCQLMRVSFGTAPDGCRVRLRPW